MADAQQRKHEIEARFQQDAADDAALQAKARQTAAALQAAAAVDQKAAERQLAEEVVERREEWKQRARAAAERELDDLQAALDVGGMLPVIGEPLDIANGCISLCRGRWGDAALNFGNAIPGLGNLVTGGKWIAKASFFWGLVRVAGNADNVADAARVGAKASGATTTVSRWGRPGLETGDWVMKGGVNYRNYVLSGKWQPWDPVFRNQFAPYGSGQQFVVPPSMLEWPAGVLGVPKGILGQRIYVGPGIPLP